MSLLLIAVGRNSTNIQTKNIQTEPLISSSPLPNPTAAHLVEKQKPTTYSSESHSLECVALPDGYLCSPQACPSKCTNIKEAIAK